MLFIESTVCDTPLGMENHRIPDSQITASTVYYNLQTHGATHARLNRPNGYSGSSGGWEAGVNDVHQWIQVDLGIVKIVSGIVLQGRDGWGHWVRKYQVHYSADSVSWMWVTNVNQKDVAVRMLPSFSFILKTGVVSWVSSKSAYATLITAKHTDVTTQNPYLGQNLVNMVKLGIVSGWLWMPTNFLIIFKARGKE